MPKKTDKHRLTHEACLESRTTVENYKQDPQKRQKQRTNKKDSQKLQFHKSFCESFL